MSSTEKKRKASNVREFDVEAVVERVSKRVKKERAVKEEEVTPIPGRPSQKKRTKSSSPPPPTNSRGKKKETAAVAGGVTKAKNKAAVKVKVEASRGPSSSSSSSGTTTTTTFMTNAGTSGHILHDDGVMRCSWMGKTLPADYLHYHDTEWCKPYPRSDSQFLEGLALQCMQAGLSWMTVLRKRQNFRDAFDNFEVDKVAKYDAKKVERLMENAGIIRNRLKINAIITNAQKIQSMGGSSSDSSMVMYRHALEFVGATIPIPPHPSGYFRETMPASDALSADLLSRGFKFVGPKIVYSFFQGMGLVNDHNVGCAFFPREHS